MEREREREKKKLSARACVCIYGGTYQQEEKFNKKCSSFAGR
jgi:hypothetical protein